MRVVGNICIHTDIALSSNQPLIIECWFAERDLQAPCTNVHQIQSQQVTGTTNSTVSPVPRSHLSLSANQPQIIWIICTRRPAISLHTRLTSCTSSLTQQSNRTPCNFIAFMHTECRDNKSLILQQHCSAFASFPLPQSERNRKNGTSPTPGAEQVDAALRCDNASKKTVSLKNALCERPA